ncbi:Chitinase 1 [Gryganskiella cystojenkinii]|nr:Chitinase 1 [Gryganskiella cystojenkinii]
MISVSNTIPGSAEGSLSRYCDDSTIDVLVLGFIYQISNGIPVLNLAGHCTTYFPGTQILNCPDVARDIKTCQQNGKAIILSIGGASGTYTLPDASSGEQFATQIWNQYLGGESTTRPFGNVILDGIDLDLESGGAETGYAIFVNELRSKFKSGSRPYYITAAPQCVFPDAATSYALDHAWFDMVWVQFYNNNCGVDTFGQGGFNFDTWHDWATGTSQNKDVRILLGVPGGPRAAGRGVIDASTLNTIMKQVQTYSSFGGVMMWDAGIARQSGLAASAAEFLSGSGKSQGPSPPKAPKPTITRPTVPQPTISKPSRTHPSPPLTSSQTVPPANPDPKPTVGGAVPPAPLQTDSMGKPNPAYATWYSSYHTRQHQATPTGWYKRDEAFATHLAAAINRRSH